MAIQQKKGCFALRSAIGALSESVASFWKPMIVAAPLIGTALFFASGTFAQTSGGVAPTAPASSSGPVAPIETAAAARRKGPKVKVKEAMDTSRVANPHTTTEPVAQPETARTGRPKIKEGHQTPLRVGDPVTQTPAPTEKRRKGPKVRDDDLRDTSRTGRPKERDDSARDTSRTEAPAPETQPAGRRKEGPKGDGSSDAAGGRTEAPAPDTQPAGRRREGPKGAGSHGRTATTPLIIGALGAATVLALVVSSGNDRPASP